MKVTKESVTSTELTVNIVMEAEDEDRWDNHGATGFWSSVEGNFVPTVQKRCAQLSRTSLFLSNTGNQI